MDKWTDISKLTEDELVDIISGNNLEYSHEEIEHIVKVMKHNASIKTELLVLTGYELQMLRRWLVDCLQALEIDTEAFSEEESQLWNKLMKGEKHAR